MTRLPSTPDCAIKGCTYARYRGYLCRKHYALIPTGTVVSGMMDVFAAQFKAADKNHRKQLHAVRALLVATRSAEQS